MTFLVEPGGLQLHANMLGERRAGRTIVCTELGDVYQLDGTRCRGTRFEWREDRASPIAIRCKPTSLDGHAGVSIHGLLDYDEVAFFDGDRLHDVTTKLPPPMRPE